jgi:protein phosphatase
MRKKMQNKNFNTKKSITESQNISPSEFSQLIENVKNILIKERDKSGGYLVHLSSQKERLIVVGDLHGDLKNLEFILRENEPFGDKWFLFLGDYGDRGNFSPEVYFLILKLKKQFPKKTILLRGNHEFPSFLKVSPHDLPSTFQKKFREEGNKLYQKIKELWNFLPRAAILPEKYLFLHGGISNEVKTLEDFSSEKFLEEILWSDPRDGIFNTRYNPRGAGKLFGKNVTKKVLKSLRVKTLIRSHEPCNEGFKINHEGLILTIFSRKGAPYWNEKASYLKINLEDEAKDAYELVKENVRIF